MYVSVNILKFLSVTGVLSSHCTEYLLRGIALKIGTLHYRMFAKGPGQG